MAIYNIPAAQTVTSSLGTKDNPIFKEDLSTTYGQRITKCQHSIVEYSSVYTDFRTLFYAFSGGELPSLPADKLAKLNAEITARQNEEANATSDTTTQTKKQTTPLTKTDSMLAYMKENKK